MFGMNPLKNSQKIHTSMCIILAINHKFYDLYESKFNLVKVLYEDLLWFQLEVGSGSHWQREDQWNQDSVWLHQIRHYCHGFWNVRDSNEFTAIKWLFEKKLVGHNLLNCIKIVLNASYYSHNWRQYWNLSTRYLEWSNFRNNSLLKATVQLYGINYSLNYSIIILLIQPSLFIIHKNGSL